MYVKRNQAQRDRFRRRIKELEAEREDEQREARATQTVMETLQRDNLQLYEKVCLTCVCAHRTVNLSHSSSTVAEIAATTYIQPPTAPAPTLFLQWPQVVDLSFRCGMRDSRPL